LELGLDIRDEHANVAKEFSLLLKLELEFPAPSLLGPALSRQQAYIPVLATESTPNPADRRGAYRCRSFFLRSFKTCSLEDWKE
jgi:hypothetical protein